ncbi:hypothetical protein BDA99DRAFT_569613 [Phascolomyces articulosus]|uniref:DNA-directed DNA polymerase family B exonuclease domain-containing protein n=1 Tax=Phascolomyces articulosus TaxID=60185 RepID=A0AAD5K6S8_9FUNG|nr:hypothetical protein BDA99DRAFT_569613 [Phascolomyces articulosus]
MNNRIINNLNSSVHIDDVEEFDRLHFQYIEEALRQQQQEIIDNDFRMTMEMEFDINEEEDEEEDFDSYFEPMSQEDITGIDKKELRILSVDIECTSRPKTFPQSHIDSIIQIGNTCVTLCDFALFGELICVSDDFAFLFLR